ncbi:holo-ACP synthase [Kineococcus sp. R8]|uniref:holo-ACP synthase n=1 Tax=Kineococcus siccus TaxID=2696567 RepID=UPI0014127FD0|nr:holo-ACP synthase [Kineococcus siccus]NAZ80371.1 holo-ACP synthase [Kineococcus siccus]
MIVGIGIDVVDVARFVRQIERTPRLLDRLFGDGERGLPAESLAARFAAKEAVAKSLGAPVGLVWTDVVVAREDGHRPEIVVRGSVARRAAEMGVETFHLSLSHDAGIASAMVVAEGR